VAIETATTRDRLLRAAERLYAERGLDGVSLREITEAAGQRNNAAVHYHFGGRDGLVRALFEQRFAALDAQRAALLAQLDAEGKGGDVTSLVRVLVAPFAEAGDGPDGHWVRFVARLHEDPRFNPFAGDLPYTASEDVTVATREVSARIRRALGLSTKVGNERFFLVTTMAVHAVADRQALVAGGVAERMPSGPRLVELLVESAVRVLSG
jgi:AcrR family transcriptional regulator